MAREMEAAVAETATDVSDRALRRAEEGVYSERSMHDVSEARRRRFFTQADRRSEVGEQLRATVRFSKHNLITDPAPPAGESPFDLILCRNVLIYFSAKTVEAVVSSLESALRPGGQLILGASDRLSSSAQRLAGIAAGPPASITTRAAEAPRRQRTQLRRPLGRGDAPDDPLDAEAYFERGLTELAEGDPGSAIGSLRRALYIDPTFALAAFQLGRAWDARGDAHAARRAYVQALRALGQDDARHLDLAPGVGVDDIATACRARLAEHEGASP